MRDTRFEAAPGALPWPGDVVSALDSFAEQVRRVVALRALYIHGSLAQGAFRPGLSDIDFTAVAGGALSPAAIAGLRRLHVRLRVQFAGLRFNGCYVRVDETPPPPKGGLLLYVDGMHFKTDAANAWNEVTRFELATHAIPLFGPPGNSLVGASDVSSLLSWVAQNMKEYWVRWLDRMSGAGLDAVAAVLSARRVEWGVLGVSRQLYTLREQRLISKAGAGQYMLALAPAEHRRILEEALRVRRGRGTRRYVDGWQRRRDAVAYMRWVIAEASKHGTMHAP
jgi:hypothetical protein